MARFRGEALTLSHVLLCPEVRLTLSSETSEELRPLLRSSIAIASARATSPETVGLLEAVGDWHSCLECMEQRRLQKNLEC